MMQGHGKLGVWDIETPALIRYGQLTNDEFFVSEKAAMEGVSITNASKTDPIVMLKHFGPGNPDLITQPKRGKPNYGGYLFSECKKKVYYFYNP